jgi:membrane protease YdiL (CAAX protease family)
MKQTLCSHRLSAFFALTFGIAWGIPGLALLLSALTGAFEASLEEFSPLSYLAIWSPAIAAFTVIGVTQGWAGIRAYARRLLHWRVGWVWWTAVLLGVPLMSLMASALMSAIGQPGLVVPTAWGAFLMSSLLKGTEGPFEELGWRGYALPLLQRRFSGWQSAIVLGFVWALWHVPAFFVASVMTGALEGELAVVLLRFFVGTIATSIIMTAVYNGTGGSIPLVFIYHWLMNLPYPWEARAGISLMQDVVGVVVAVVLVIVLGRRYLGRENLYTDVTPGAPEPCET